MRCPRPRDETFQLPLERSLIQWGSIGTSFRIECESKAMAKFRIYEEIEIEVEADSAQQALEAWLREGENAPGYTLRVHERDVYDEHGNWCEVEEP